MVSYRTADAFDLKFGRQTAAAKKKKKQTPSPSPTPPQPQPQQEQEKEKKEGEQEQEQRHPFYQVESYLRYQGLKFQGRFDAMTYICLTRLMDTHDVGRGRAGGCAGAVRACVCVCVRARARRSQSVLPFSRYIRMHACMHACIIRFAIPFLTANNE